MKLHAPKTRLVAFRHIALFAASLVLIGSTATSQATNSVTLVMDRFREVGSILEKHHLITDSAKCADAVVKAWIEAVDPLAMYSNAEEAQSWLALEDGAVFEAGFRVVATNKDIVIGEIAPASHAADAGLQSGDRLVAVDRAPTSGEPPERVQSWLELTTKRTFVLTVEGENGTPRDVSLEPVASRKPPVALAETLPTGLGYLKLNGFYPTSEGEILSTIRRWIGTTNYCGLVLDLRGAAGRDVHAAAAVASIFATEGRLMATFRSPYGQETATFRAGPAFTVTFPVMILTDSETRGAAEWFAAVVKGLGRGAMLIGSATHGDPLIREYVPLSWNHSVYIITRQLITADGTVYPTQQNVSPHIVVPPLDETPYVPPATDAADKVSEQEQQNRRLRNRIGHDAVLRRAVELLLGLRALNVGS